MATHYELRRDPRTFAAPWLFAAMSAAIFTFTLVMVGFKIWLVVLAMAVTLLVYLSWEMNYRVGNHLILHADHYDVRQDGWGRRDRAERTTIPYARILRLRVIGDAEVEVVYAKERLTGEPERDMESIGFHPQMPHAVALDLQARVDRAL